MNEKSIQDQVIEDLESRKQIGLENYGTLLYAKAHGKDMDQEADGIRFGQKPQPDPRRRVHASPIHRRQLRRRPPHPRR